MVDDPISTPSDVPPHRWHKPVRVYPPCDTRALQALPLDRRLKRLYLISVAQFRWEQRLC